MSMKSGQYHKKCFTCFSCKANLDYSSANDSPLNEILCKYCYKQSFGPSSIPQELESHYRTDTIKVSGGKGCPKCQGAVYDAERVTTTSGVSYHASCARCVGCDTKLTSLNLCSDKAGLLYCPGCLARRTGGAGYRGGAGGGAWADGSQPRPGTITRDSLALIRPGEAGAGCLRCGGAVFEAEKVLISNKIVFHRNCFNCQGCGSSLDALKVMIAPDNKAFCKNCYKMVLKMDSHNLNIATDSIMADSEDKSGCPVCGGRVYEAEKIATKTSWWHKSCFRCESCKHKLDMSSYIEAESKIYCKTCYGRNICDSTRNKFGDKAGVRAGEGDKAGCLRCGDKVFSVDKVLAKAGVYHRGCLSCGGCGTGLNVTNFLSGGGDTGEIFCRQCYAARWGVMGRAGSVTRTQVTEIMAGEGDPDMCLRCGGRVYSAEKMTTSAGQFHKSCFSCVNCLRTLDSYTVYCGQDSEIYCKNCYQESFGTMSRRSRSRAQSRAQSRATSRSRRRSRSGSITNLDSIEGNRIIADSMINTTSIKAKDGAKDGCPRCGGRVFEAEKMMTRTRVFHRKCFSCEECSRALDSSNVAEGPGGDTVYCHNCYGKLYGPTVRHFDEEAARKYITAALCNFVADKEGEKGAGCPRCGARVYRNEEVRTSGGRAYHRGCAKCATCARQLDLTSIYEGTDKDLYCKGCYGRKFGTAGFRGIISNSWTDESSSQISKPTSDLKVFPTEDEKLACIRCKGKVFDTEKVSVTKGLFHKKCFTCASCSKTLEMGQGNCAANREVYCRQCYCRVEGLQGYGWSGGSGSVPPLTSTQSLTSQEEVEAKTEYHYKQFF